ncbi:retrovirus-related pol polyprotein from transposon TNT 1-94 [Tanacetum coccineum]
MQNREHGRMILESVENCPLIWPTVEENGVTRTKKYVELSAAEKIQADCDMKATNIILQSLRADIYSLEKECKLYDAFDKFTHIKGESLHNLPPEWSKFVTDVKLVKDLHTTNFDQLHAYLEQHELHANEVHLLRFAIPVFSPGDDPIACLNKAMAFLTLVASLRGDKGNIILVLVIRVMLLVLGETIQVDKQRLLNATTVKLKDIWLGNTEDLDTYDSDYDNISNAKAVLMANISNYGSDAISEVPHSKTYLNDMENQSLHAMHDFEQAQVVDFIDNKIHNDMIKEKLTLKEQVDSLEQNLSKQIKEKECLLQTFMVFKNESKEKENKYMENEIDLEKKIKELDNIIFKVGQSAQTVHMLTKPQAFYDNIHKQALGYQNPFYLKKAQRIKPTLYDGIVISAKHVAMPVIDDEETLILEEESRSKMSEKEKDPEAIKQNISHKPIDYEKLNRLSDDFGKRFTPQQELSAEQAFWLRMSNPTSKPSDASPVKIEAPKELPKVSLVNESLKKLKFHLARFDNVVKIRTTPDARTEGEWGFEHTKAVFNNEIIPFLKSLKDIFNVFDKDLLNEIMEVQTVFDQMDVVVQQSLVDKQCLEIAKKELLLENDRLFNKSSQLQDKDTTICKLKDIIKSMREKSKEENVNYDYGEIETKNVELENSVPKLLLENERLCNEINHVKQVFKEQFDSIKKTRVHTKEHSDSLTDKLNLKSAENEDLKAQIQDKLDLEPLAPRLLKIREAYIDYLKYTQEQADILQGIVEQAKAKQPLDKELDFTCRTFTIVGNSCPLTRITSANVVPPKKSTSHSVETQKLELKVYSRKPKNVKNVVQIILWYLDSRCLKHITGNHSQLMNFVSKFLGTVRFRNDHITRIMGYGDYQLGNVTISRVYYIERLGHNLIFVGQFCDVDLKVAFWKNTCFIHNLEGVDLLSGSRDTNLYTISLDDMLKTSLIFLQSKESKLRAGYGTIACALGKSKKSSHQPIAEDTNQEKLYLLHMDLCGSYVWQVLTGKDNGTEIVNQTLSEFYENVGISHQTSVARTPQQNDIAEAINTVCYTKNRSLIRLQYNKTPYELMKDKKPDLSFFHVFDALCYPTNDNDDMGKLDAKVDIGIFVAYAPVKKVFRIYSKRTRKIIETIHVTFDELTAMASE